MNLIPGVDTSEETLVLEQLAYQSALYLPLTDSAVNIQDNDTLRDIVSKTVSAIDRGEIKRSDIAEYQKYIKELVDITSVAKDRKAPSGGKSRTREADDAAIFA